MSDIVPLTEAEIAKQAGGLRRGKEFRLDLAKIPKSLDDLPDPCMPTDLDDLIPDPRRRVCISNFINFFREIGNAYKARDAAGLSRSSLVIWRKDPNTQWLMNLVDDASTSHAIETIDQLKYNNDPSIQLKASESWLGAHMPDKWDKGVRRERERTKGNIAESIFNRSLDPTFQKAFIANDPFALDAAQPAIAYGPSSPNLAPFVDPMPDNVTYKASPELTSDASAKRSPRGGVSVDADWEMSGDD